MDYSVYPPTKSKNKKRSATVSYVRTSLGFEKSFPLKLYELGISEMGRNNRKQTKRSVNPRTEHNRLSVPLSVREQHKSDYEKLQESVGLLLKLSTTVPPPTMSSKSLEHHNAISVIIDKIKNLELGKSRVENAESNARNSPDKLASFTKWLKDNGAVYDGCSIAEFPGYDLGLKADVDIPYGSLFLAVPRKLMLTIEGAKRSILRRFIEKDKLLKNMPNVALAMYLLVEKFKDNSFYKPYIDVLPRTYSTVLYFTKAELAELKGSPTLELALKHLRSTARQYSYFHTIFSNNDDDVSRLLKEHFTYDEYCWAVSTVMTRQNYIPSDEDSETKVSALIPLWDLCNHTNGIISTDYNPELKRSECLALKDFKQGEQLFIFYGPRTNAEFFIHNGFVPDENEFDSYALKLGISKDDPLGEKRTALLRKLGIGSCQEFRLALKENPIDGKLLAFLRIFNMDEDQLDYWIKSNKSGDLEYLECALDVALEKKTWSYFQLRLKLMYMNYPTKLKEDEKILEEQKMSQNTLIVVKMRKSEKEILVKTLDWVKQHVQQ